MVRREEQPWESRATLVLDTRAGAHRGEGPTASFEWAVSAVASVAMHLRAAGYKLRLVTDAGADLDATESAGDGVILDHLAEVKLSQRGTIAHLVDRVRHRADGGLIVAVTGLLSPAEAELLGQLRGSNATCVGILVDSTSWLNLATTAREEADRAHGTVAIGLLRSGWRVIGVRHGDRLPALWPRAARGSQGFAVRAAMAEVVTGGTP
jgi:uncharacterized protein (DUF58 family)